MRSGKPQIRSRFRNLGWFLLGVYLLVLAGLFFLCSLVDEHTELGEILLPLGMLFGTQAIFLFTAGTRRLCRPIRKARLVIPILMAGGLMTLLAVAMFFALDDLFQFDRPQMQEEFGYGIVFTSWAAWGVFFYVHVKGLERFQALRNIITVLLISGLIEVVVAVPALFITAGRDAWLAGIVALFAAAAGVSVILWASGPGIVLLILHRRRQIERHRAGGLLPSSPDGLWHGPLRG